MEIPKQIQVGKRVYSINQRRKPRRRFTVGEVNYGQQYIDVVTHSNFTGRAFKSEELLDTFWHELTHAILYEMKSPLHNDEAFVTKFSGLLNKAVLSAKF
jgi:hypothetical protein